MRCRVPRSCMQRGAACACPTLTAARPDHKHSLSPAWLGVSYTPSYRPLMTSAGKCLQPSAAARHAASGRVRCASAPATSPQAAATTPPYHLAPSPHYPPHNFSAMAPAAVHNWSLSSGVFQAHRADLAGRQPTSAFRQTGGGYTAATALPAPSGSTASAYAPAIAIAIASSALPFSSPPAAAATAAGAVSATRRSPHQRTAASALAPATPAPPAPAPRPASSSCRGPRSAPSGPGQRHRDALGSAPGPPAVASVSGSVSASVAAASGQEPGPVTTTGPCELGPPVDAASAATDVTSGGRGCGGEGPARPPGLPVAAPQLPLCRRPAVNVDELQAVLDWKAHMADQISQLGDSLEQQDGGPDMQGLLRELEWVLDDVIEACRPGLDAPWEETSWRMLQPQLRAAAYQRRELSGWQLRLRAPVAQLWEWWQQRLRDRVPFQYLISSAHWHTYVLSVGPGVLVPRPETEIFPELVRSAICGRPYLAAAPWADLGTGSGAIAIATADVLRERYPAAEVWAVDLSPVAVSYARFNAHLCLYGGSLGNRASASTSTPSSTFGSSSSSAAIPDVTAAAPACIPSGTPVRVVQGSWFEPIRHLRGQLGGVLSNPPYIPRVQMAGLQAEVGRHEPWSALDGGEGPGLDSLQALCSEAAAMLAPGGLIALETAGGDQADFVAELLRKAMLPYDATDLDPGYGKGIRADGAAVLADLAQSTAQVEAELEPTQFGLVAEPQRGCFPAFEGVEVLEDCYGVRRFVRAYRRGGAGL